MNIKIRTIVPGHFQAIMQAFDRQLFEALAPKMARMEIIEFTGSKKGDRVHVRFTKPLSADWISEITEDARTDSKAWFIDEGIQLPWPLARWKHIHLVRQVDDQRTEIVDDISFTGRNGLLSVLLYPFILLGFLPRKRIYKAYFSKQQT